MRRGFSFGKRSMQHSTSELVQEAWEWDTLVRVEGDLRGAEEVLQATVSTSMVRITSTFSKTARAPTVRALETKAKGASPTKEALVVQEPTLTGQVTREAGVSLQDTQVKEEAKAGEQASRSLIINNQISTSSRIQVGHHQQVQEHSSSTPARRQAKIQTKAACRTNNE